MFISIALLSKDFLKRLNQPMNYPAAEQRDIRCHAGPDPASSLDFWIKP